jgi:hypothetical protein
MEMNAAVIVGLVSVTAFIGAIVWAEVHTRRQRRRGFGGGDATVPPALASEPPASPARPKRRK